MFRNKTPFQAGLFFGLIAMVFVALYKYFEGATINLELLKQAILGGVTGGLVYGGIEWLKRRNQN